MTVTRSAEKSHNNGKKHICVGKMPQLGTIFVGIGLTVLLLFWTDARPSRPSQFMFAQAAFWIVEMKRRQPPLLRFISLPLKNRYAPFQKNSLLSEIFISECKKSFHH